MGFNASKQPKRNLGCETFPQLQQQTRNYFPNHDNKSISSINGKHKNITFKDREQANTYDVYWWITNGETNKKIIKAKHKNIIT